MSAEKKHFFDAWLLWIMTYECNLRCAYCWYNLGADSALFNHVFSSCGQNKTITHKRIPVERYGEKECACEKKNNFLGDVFAGQMRMRTGFLKNAQSIDIDALKKFLAQADKKLCIVLGGGEPFLIPNIIDICAEITKKHYLGINTNLTAGNIVDFTKKIDPSKVVFIEASCHIEELERACLLDTYVRHFRACKEKKFNINAVERAYPPLAPKVKKYQDFFAAHEIELKFGKFCGKYKNLDYPEAYTPEEKRIFCLEQTTDTSMFYSKGCLCNAGYNACVVFPSGRAEVCCQIHESLGSIFKKITFKNELRVCPHEYCGCPLNTYIPYL